MERLRVLWNVVPSSKLQVHCPWRRSSPLCRVLSSGDAARVYPSPLQTISSSFRSSLLVPSLHLEASIVRLHIPHVFNHAKPNHALAVDNGPGNDCALTKEQSGAATAWVDSLMLDWFNSLTTTAWFDYLTHFAYAGGKGALLYKYRGLNETASPHSVTVSVRWFGPVDSGSRHAG
jgi:hypothetical protein